jgi:transposase
MVMHPEANAAMENKAWGARGRTNAIGALLGSCLLTVSLFQNNIDTPTFKAWLLQDLLPKLPACSIIVMDNASFHKTLPIKTIIEASGHTLEYLPPYSPDLNPIEHKWAQAKAMRRAFSCSLDELFQCPSL